MAEDIRAIIDRYELSTSFHNPGAGDVIHITYENGVAVEERWAKVRRLGSGGFGAAFLERNSKGRYRVVRSSAIGRGIGITNLSKAMVRLQNHRDCQGHFVRFLGWFSSGFHLNIAMEFIELGDLSHYIQHQEIKNNTRDITRQVLKGLAALHELSIVHRDIRPQHILVVSLKPVRVKIGGFGILKLLDNTELRTRIGTRRYKAPEILGLVRWGDRGFSPAADMWSMGCLVHELLTSMTPFLEHPDVSNDTNSSITDVTPGSLDIAQMLSFCRGDISFPTDILHSAQADTKAIELVKSLLNSTPEYRLTAAKALESPWLMEACEQGMEASHFSMGIEADVPVAPIVLGSDLPRAGPRSWSDYEMNTMASETVDNYVSHNRDGLEEIWRTVDLLGAGGQGSVYLQGCATAGSVRAVKVIACRDQGSLALPTGSRPQVGDEHESRRNQIYLNRELRVMVTIREHDDLFGQLFGWYLGEEDLFLAMEFACCGDLGGYMQQNEHDARAQCTPITAQLLLGLTILHANGICHGDIKPENVLLTSLRPVRLKLADFGVSTFTGEGETRRAMGTWAYAAPETLNLLPSSQEARCNINRTAGASDMWALGCIVFEIFTGQIPFAQRPQGLDTAAFQCRPVSTLMTGILHGGQPELDLPQNWRRSPNLMFLEDFCKGQKGLPMHVLRSSGCPSIATLQAFIECLLRAEPRDRMTAAEALDHDWITRGAQCPERMHSSLGSGIKQEQDNLQSVDHQEMPQPTGASITNNEAALSPSISDVDSLNASVRTVDSGMELLNPRALDQGGGILGAIRRNCRRGLNACCGGI